MNIFIQALLALKTKYMDGLIANPPKPVSLILMLLLAIFVWLIVLVKGCDSPHTGEATKPLPVVTPAAPQVASASVMQSAHIIIHRGRIITPQAGESIATGSPEPDDSETIDIQLNQEASASAPVVVVPSDVHEQENDHSRLGVFVGVVPGV